MPLSTKNIALIIAFAPLQVILSLLPFTITIGVSGTITLGLVGGPLMGIVLGPITGGLTVLIGSIAGMFLNPAGALFGWYSVLPPFFGAIGAGCAKIKKGYLSAAVILLSILVFYAHPFGREAYLYPWLHFVAMILALSPLATSVSPRFMKSRSIKAIEILVATFVGVLTDHITGSAIAMWYFSPYLTPETWNLIMYVYPLERIAASVLAYVIITPIYYSLVKTGLADIIEDQSKSPKTGNKTKA